MLRAKLHRVLQQNSPEADSGDPLLWGFGLKIIIPIWLGLTGVAFADPPQAVAGQEVQVTFSPEQTFEDVFRVNPTQVFEGGVTVDFPASVPEQAPPTATIDWGYMGRYTIKPAEIRTQISGFGFELSGSAIDDRAVEVEFVLHFISGRKVVPVAICQPKSGGLKYLLPTSATSCLSGDGKPNRKLKLDFRRSGWKDFGFHELKD
ncbi:MAG: hypothetical protein WDN76_06235 [Alphaproteobacteria bacterium]